VTRWLGLIVTDASPLITLAAGEALECLTMPGVAVIIPDMVYAEVTEDLARLGAEDIVQWARRHHGQVEIAPTIVFAEYQALRGINPQTRSKGRGEQAAMEVLDAAVAENADLEAVLVFEDSDIRKRRFVRGLPDRVMALSTGDLLRELEAAGRIQSADRVLDVAAEKERNVEAQRQPQSDAEARKVLRERLAGRDRSGPEK
jgi:predicted nuclease of predicted toxin-antitoxin system